MPIEITYDSESKMKAFSKLPPEFRCDEVKEYYDILSRKKASLVVKRVFDIILSVILLVILIIPIIIISVAVKLSSKGSVLFKQERVTTYGKRFKILKFRTMVQDADKMGTLVTTDSDSRVTKIGHFLRKYRLDELPQIFNVLSGSMSIVGTRPEVPSYVNRYKPEFYATLLIPAGITSLTSIMYKDEEKLLSSSDNADEVYINKILPDKMKYNLQYTKEFGFFSDIKIMFKTIKGVLS